MLEGILKTKDYRNFTVEHEATGALLLAFDGAARAGAAFHGDFVLWKGDAASGSVAFVKRRASSKLFLVGTLELAAKVRYGMTSRGSPLYRFTPFSEAYPPFFVGCAQRDTTRNILARIEFDKWTEASTCPQGVLVQTFGPAGDLAAEEEALLAHWGAERWRRGDLPASLDSPEPASPVSDLPLEAFHIDPPGCRDIDDAISLVPLEG